MTKKSIQLPAGAKELFETNGKLAKAANSSLTNALRTVGANSSAQKLLKQIDQRAALFSAAEGPIPELRQAGVFSAMSPIQQKLANVGSVMATLDARFHLPAACEAARLMTEFRSSHVSIALQRYSEQATAVQQAMQAMHTPWLDTSEAMRSVAGFAELQGIGHAVANMPAFGENLAGALRVDLGDWRDKITWPEGIFTNLVERSEFYSKLGFDSALTDFPAPAFQQSVEIAGLRGALPPLVAHYGAPVPPSEDGEEEEGLVRTNMAHDWLQRLESQLRRFSDDQMTQAYGPNWPKHRLPKGLYDKWQEKKSNAERAGARGRSLTAYADFTDYERVICKKDNWREVFAIHFVTPESVRESFQRMHPIRIDTMHSRPITQDDELLLYVETKRLVKVIAI